MSEEFLFVEKYRPKKIEDCILTKELKDTFGDFIKQGRLPHFLFTGTAGVGKTTVAKALCNEIGAEYIVVNGSDEGRSIDVLRTLVQGFATTVSLTGAKKVVIMDEADGMNPQSVQPALRAFMEDFSSNCSFIFTCNYKNRIIEPIQSRCSVIEFKTSPKENTQIKGEFFKRVLYILDTEDIKYDKAVVAQLINKYFPDFRRTLNELQRYSVSGMIDTGILVDIGKQTYNTLFEHLKKKSFNEVRKWVGENSDIDSVVLFRELYDSADVIMEQTSIPELVMILGDYQDRAPFVGDQEINNMCAMTEIMAKCKFKGV